MFWVLSTMINWLQLVRAKYSKTKNIECKFSRNLCVKLLVYVWECVNQSLNVALVKDSSILERWIFLNSTFCIFRSNNNDEYRILVWHFQRYDFTESWFPSVVLVSSKRLRSLIGICPVDFSWSRFWIFGMKIIGYYFMSKIQNHEMSNMQQ